MSSDSPAGISGLSDGDIILQINGVPSTEITHQQGINMIKAAGLTLDLVAERFVVNTKFSAQTKKRKLYFHRIWNAKGLIVNVYRYALHFCFELHAEAKKKS